MVINFCFYVPKTHLEEVKNAIFSAGAGVIGEYSHCCWQVKGQGQFLPGADSSPFLGSHQKLTTLEEYKVEVLCQRDKMTTILQEFFNAHPYETPAYFITTHFDIEDL